MTIAHACLARESASLAHVGFQGKRVFEVRKDVPQMSQRNFHLGSQSANNCSGVSVTVNSGHPAGYIPGSAVTVRPVLTQASTATPRQQAIAKVLLKAVNRKKKTAGAKMFTLRNVNTSIINTCSQMKALIRDQLHNDITEGNFDIGYLQSNTVISIRSKEDLAEIWANIKKGINITLWCDGLRVTTVTTSRQKRRYQTNSDSDVDSGDEDNPPSKKKTKEDRVQKIVDDLKKQHGEKYTTMQYRIWAETVNGGMHKSTTEPPSSSMFNRAGGASTSGNKKSNDAVSEAVSQITSALTPRLASLPPSKSNSPAKIIDNRSKCYRQLGELKSLFESGLLSEAEYTAEREAIMSTLQKLSETGK